MESGTHQKNTAVPAGLCDYAFYSQVGFGELFFEAGLSKFTEGFPAAGFLSHITGPLSGFYTGLVPYVGAFYVLVPWAELLQAWP
jgi:hypothetical protein